MGGNDGHVGTASGLTPSGDYEEEWLIPVETILIEDDEGGYLLGDVEQFIMVSIHKAIIYYCRLGLIYINVSVFEHVTIRTQFASKSRPTVFRHTTDCSIDIPLLKANI